MAQAWMHVGDTWFSTQDLTVDELCSVEAELGESWATIAPARSSTHARALFVRLVARSCEGGDPDTRNTAARLIVGAWSVDEMTDRLRLTADDDRPIEHADGVPVVDTKEDTAGSGTT